MNAIKRNTKLLINSKATWKNAERPKSDSTVKSSKFMVNGWQFSKRPIMNYSSFLTNASLTYIPYMISSLPPIQVLMLIEFEPSYNRVRIELELNFRMAVKLKTQLFQSFGALRLRILWKIYFRINLAQWKRGSGK